MKFKYMRITAIVEGHHCYGRTYKYDLDHYAGLKDVLVSISKGGTMEMETERGELILSAYLAQRTIFKLSVWELEEKLELNPPF